MKTSNLFLPVLIATVVTADCAFAQFRGRGGMRAYSRPEYRDPSMEEQRAQYRYGMGDGLSTPREQENARSIRRESAGLPPPPSPGSAQESRNQTIQTEHHVQPCPYTPIGQRVSTLPAGCRPLPGVRPEDLPGHDRRKERREERRCYYWGGMYYAGDDDSGYETVPAPAGAQIDALPAGYVTITAGSETYYYYQGTFYQWDPATQTYTVVAGPPGAVVPSIPEGYTTQNVNGQTYYTYGDTHYRLVWQNGQRAYSVVEG